MAGLHGQDGPGCGQVGCTHDVGGSAQVGADAHALEDGGGHDEVRGIGDAEVVRAGSHWGCASLGESSCQETNVRGFVRGDFLQVGIESRVEASLSEVGFGKVAETFSVESVFEMLEGKSIVEDIGVGDRWGGLADLLQEGATVESIRERFIEKNKTYSTTHVWATGLAAATAAKAATRNVAFIVFRLCD